MENVLKLANYRAKRQKAWLAKNKLRLFSFLYEYISHHIGMNFLEAFTSYQNLQLKNQQEAWDYVDLRELLHEGLAGQFCELLYQDLRKEWWFEPKFLSREEALEHCLSLYIMDSLHSLKLPKPKAW